MSSAGMERPRALSSKQHVAFETFAVRVAVSTNHADVLPRLRDLPAAQSRPCDFDATDHRYSFMTDDGARFDVRYDVRAGKAAEDPYDTWAWVAGATDLDLAFAMFEPHLHSVIGMYAPDHLFIRAGVVAHQGRLIMLPGKGLTGKTTLVAALVNAGATYYSDQFAVVDEEGRVYPYAKPLSPHIPMGGSDEAVNGRLSLIGQEPRPPAAIVLTSYLPGADWRPRRLALGESVLSLISHAAPAQERPQDAMRVITSMMKHDPVVLESERGEAEAVVPLLLSELDRQLARSA
jgi:hypothetical protein